jgi:hypothetical protein
MTNETIEEAILDFMRDAPSLGILATRENAIFQVTGRLGVLPSAVTRVLAAMVAAGKIKHISGDRLIFPE